MSKSNLEQEPKFTQLHSNESLLLDWPDTFWVVRSGSLLLFALQLEASQLTKTRSYMFTIQAGEALFGSELVRGISPEQQWGILAIALEEAILEKLTLRDLAEQISHGDSAARMLLQGWLNHISQWLAQKPSPFSLPAERIYIQDTHFLSLLSGQGLMLLAKREEEKNILWIKVNQGSMCWMGCEALKLEAGSPMIPLASDLCLAAETTTEVYTCLTEDLENLEDLPKSLAQVHRYCLYYFSLVKELETENEFSRFQQREQLNRRALQSSMGELMSVLQPQKADLWPLGSPLLIAAGAVGRSLGIKVLPPARSEDIHRVKDPLEAISRSSQFSTRRVHLVHNWWKGNYGALLAYLSSNQSPVALLPDEKHHYVLFIPESHQRIPVTATVAANLAPDAYMFYRPLPILLKNVWEIFYFGIKGHQQDLLWLILLGLVGSLLGMVTPQATAILINNAIPDSDRLFLGQLGLALIAAAFGKSIFGLAQGIITIRIENVADSNLQPAVWERLLKLSPSFFRKYASGDLLNRLMGISQIRRELSGATQRTLLSAVFSLINLALMFVYSVPLTFIAIGLSILVALITFVSSKQIIQKQRLQENIDGQITGLTVELINGVAKLRVAAAEQRAFAAWAKQYSQRIKLQASIKRLDDSVTVFNEALSLISSVWIFWFAILFIQMGEAQGAAATAKLTVGGFLAFNSAFGTFLGGTTDLSNTLTDILGIVPLWERIQPILTSAPESDPTKADPGRLTGQITLSHVTFRYREDGPLILEDVSISIEPGEFVAIVGPSGSGKSTIFRLLLGFETALSGTIYYDGQDLAGLNIQAVRRQLGVVLQNVRISAGSLFDNITAGALVSLEEAWEAAQMAGFSEDIKQMPMGMHTVISEGGTNLSGGQKQRLLIARALVMKPKIILMDEATSALDNRTQLIITESLDRLKATRVVIAHRLSTIHNADRIYVVEGGRIVQIGTFDQLVSQEGLFARLVARQLD